MKNLFVFMGFIFLYGCSSKETTIVVEKNYPKKDRFIVSENDKRLDSITSEVRKGRGSIPDLPLYFNPKYSYGIIHFLIDDKNKVFYFDTLKNGYCGFSCVTDNKEDSINEINKNLKYLDSLNSIPKDSVIHFLNKNKNGIVEGYNSRNFSYPISFALKNDTLKGSFMHDVITYMEKNGMNRYYIRRMNEEEIKAVEKLEQLNSK